MTNIGKVRLIFKSFCHGHSVKAQILETININLNKRKKHTKAFSNPINIGHFRASQPISPSLISMLKIS